MGGAFCTTLILPGSSARTGLDTSFHDDGSGQLTVKATIRRAIETLGTRAHDSVYPEDLGKHESLWDFHPDARVDANAWLRTQIRTGAPFCAARFGADELEVIQAWRRRSSRPVFGRVLEIIATGDPLFSAVRAKVRIKKRGLDPLSPWVLKKFHDCMVDSMTKVDLLGSWIRGEAWFGESLKGAKVCRLPDLEPFRSQDPWSKALEGRKVLVVHPFGTTIKSQYEMKRLKLYQNLHVLPSFELETVIPPRAHFGEVRDASHWFELYDGLVAEVMSRQFQVAIIGAGPFGFPLAAEIKNLGRQAIHLGGATQILFGIRGERWEQDPGIMKYINDYWVRPSKEETPGRRGRRMSGSSYW